MVIGSKNALKEKEREDLCQSKGFKSMQKMKKGLQEL